MDTRDALSRLHRSTVRTNLNLRKLLDHFGIPDVTEEEVDRALAEEARALEERDLLDPR